MAATRFYQSTLDPTKFLDLDVDNIATGTTRVLTVPNQDVDLGITSYTTTVPVAGDFVVFLDATDGLLKKADAGLFLDAGNILTSLAATTASNGASLIGVQDVGSFYTATTVEGVLAEIAPRLLNNVATQDYTVTNAINTRTLDANAVTFQGLSDVVGTLINDLIAKGILS